MYQFCSGCASITKIINIHRNFDRRKLILQFYLRAQLLQMTEKSIILENINPVEIFGVNEKHLKFLQEAFPTLKIIVRGDQIKLKGTDEAIGLFEEKFNTILLSYEKFGRISERDLSRILESDDHVHLTENGETDILVRGNNGLIVKARTPNQHRMAVSSGKNDLMFAIGPAGTGKTYTAVALAVRALKNKEVRRIILTRPAVEAGENLGFYPAICAKSLILICSRFTMLYAI